MENEATCSICLELFDRPVLLPCGHNFCKVCIRNLVSSVHPSESGGKSRSFYCPQCRFHVVLGRHGIDGLPANSALHNISQLLKEHEQIPFKTKCKKCSHHEKEEENYYCSSCKVLVCPLCIIADHSGFGHSVKDFRDHIAEERQVLSASHDELAKRKKELKLNQIFLQKLITDAKASGSCCNNKAEEEVQQLISQLLSKKNEFNRQVASHVHSWCQPMETMTSVYRMLEVEASGLENDYKTSSTCTDPVLQIKALQQLQVRMTSFLTFRMRLAKPLPPPDTFPPMRLEHLDDVQRSISKIHLAFSTQDSATQTSDAAIIESDLGVAQLHNTLQGEVFNVEEDDIQFGQTNQISEGGTYQSSNVSLRPDSSKSVVDHVCNLSLVDNKASLRRDSSKSVADHVSNLSLVDRIKQHAFSGFTSPTASPSLAACTNTVRNMAARMFCGIPPGSSEPSTSCQSCAPGVIPVYGARSRFTSGPYDSDIKLQDSSILQAGASAPSVLPAQSHYQASPKFDFGKSAGSLFVFGEKKEVNLSDSHKREKSKSSHTDVTDGSDQSDVGTSQTASPEPSTSGQLNLQYYFNFKDTSREASPTSNRDSSAFAWWRDDGVTSKTTSLRDIKGTKKEHSPTVTPKNVKKKVKPSPQVSPNIKVNLRPSKLTDVLARRRSDASPGEGLPGLNRGCVDHGRNNNDDSDGSSSENSDSHDLTRQGFKENSQLLSHLDQLASNLKTKLEHGKESQVAPDKSNGHQEKDAAQSSSAARNAPSGFSSHNNDAKKSHSSTSLSDCIREFNSQLRSPLETTINGAGDEKSCSNAPCTSAPIFCPPSNISSAFDIPSSSWFQRSASSPTFNNTNVFAIRVPSSFTFQSPRHGEVQTNFAVGSGRGHGPHVSSRPGPRSLTRPLPRYHKKPPNWQRTDF